MNLIVLMQTFTRQYGMAIYVNTPNELRVEQNTRSIIGDGLLIPPAEATNCIRYRLFSTVTRLPSNQSSNLKIRPPRSFFGYCTVMSASWVRLGGIPIEYETQLLYEWYEPSFEIAEQVLCSQSDVQTSIENLALALNAGLPVNIVQRRYARRELPVTQFKFRLFNNTAIELIEEYVMVQATCDENAEVANSEPTGYPEPSVRFPTPGFDGDDPPGDAPYSSSDGDDRTVPDNNSGETPLPVGTTGIRLIIGRVRNGIADVVVYPDGVYPEYATAGLPLDTALIIGTNEFDENVSQFRVVSDSRGQVGVDNFYDNGTTPTVVIAEFLPSGAEFNFRRVIRQEINS